MSRHYTTLLTALLLANPAWSEVTISHGYSTFGDLKYPADFSHFDYANPVAPKGGTLSQQQLYGTPTFDSLNAFIIKGDSAPEVGVHIYDSLMVRAYDEPDALYGLVAETIEYPDDLSYVAFNMRPEARFNDGKPVTAEDVVFTIDKLKTQGHPYYRNALADVTDVTAETPHRVRFDLAPSAGKSLPGDLAELPILPRHFYTDDHPFNKSWMDFPLGSGPYVVDTVDAPRTIKFCRAPDYWGKDLAVSAGRSNFDCFAYEYFADDLVALEAFAAGEYLMRREYRSSSWATGYDFPAVQKGWVKKMLIDDARPANAQGFWLNLRKPELQDIRVRQALEYGFNFDWTNEKLFFGAYHKTDSFFENTDMQASGVPEGPELALLEEFRDQLDPAIFTKPAYEPYTGSPNPRDRAALRKASALLDAAGWIVGDDGKRRNASGEVLRLEFPDDSRSLERVMVPFGENLGSIGVEVQIDILDPATLASRREAFDFDILTGAWGVAVTPGAELRAFYGSRAAEQQGSNNLTGIADPVVDALIERAVQAQSREDLATVIRALDRVLRNRHIWIGNWFLGAHRVAIWDVFGIPDAAAPFDPMRNMEFWWMDQSKMDALKAAGAL